MSIKYDNWTTSGSIPGTMDLWITSDAERSNRIDKGVRAVDAIRGSGNGKSKMFTITIDPSKCFTLGVSQFTLTDVARGIRMGIFTEGTEWMSPTGRVRIIKGKLRYTHGRKIYDLPEIRDSRE